jgi:ABC-2 type transport system ATP-binding protein
LGGVDFVQYFVNFQLDDGTYNETQIGIQGDANIYTTYKNFTYNFLTEENKQLFEETPDETSRQRIGTLLETPNFYHYLSAQKNLEIAAAIKGRGKNDILAALEKVNLAHRKDSKFSTYSLGMKQRLAIASCLLGNPDLLVFDEPTNGLDPEGIAEIRTLILRLAKEGKTIIMASHLLDEVEKVCTHVAILKKGKLITAGAVDDVLVNEDIVEVSAYDITNLESVLLQLGGHFSTLKQVGNNFQLFFSMGKANLAEVNQHCFNHGIVLNHLQLKKKSLESKFFELTNN